MSQSHRRPGWLVAVLVSLSAVLCLYVATTITAAPGASHPWFAPRAGDHAPLISAHQGGAGRWPPNTMLAFRNAAVSGADVLDTDTHLTRDGALVLIHDDTVDRTTDGRGTVRDLTLAQIRGLDPAYRFTLDGGRTFPHRGSGLKVPRLEELLEGFPDRRVGVEIKAGPDAARALCDVVRSRRSQDRLLVSAVSQQTMDAFRSACPEVATSATEREVRLFYALGRVGLSEIVRPRYQSLQVPETSGGRRIMTSRFVVAAHRSGLAVQPWGIDTIEDLRRVRSLGVDGVNTDFPDRLLPPPAMSAGTRAGR